MRASLDFVFANTIEDVLNAALVFPNEQKLSVSPAAFKRPEAVIGARLDGVSKR